ncbi:MAG TPA: HEAT repeat domain-containing protein [Gammaproteobacteria bacterium]|nr:HEAT repeat domain-containing protein [Gammaproteobacteria bacterium]
MGFLSGLKAERLIERIRTNRNPAAPETVKAVAKLKKAGAGAVPRIIDALDTADKKETLLFVEVLSELLDDRTFSLFARGLGHSSPRAVAGVGWAMSSSQAYNPNQLLELLGTDNVSRPAVIEILNAHKRKLNVQELLRHAYALEPADKAAAFRIISELADERLAPDLISRMSGKDTLARVHIINILARFKLPEVQKALEAQLKDNNKMIRQAALSALAQMGADTNVGLLCSLLKDPDLDVQNKAIDVVIAANRPDTARHLIEVLKDESEYTRRAGVEVLNAIGTSTSIKDLLSALEDQDWWVRARAGDALAKIGGPRVIDAVLELVKDDDEDIRRAAMEILNTTKDERAIDHLIDATRDDDWWVRERAADALAAIGSNRAVPALLEMLSGHAKSVPVAIRALSRLGDHKAVPALLPLVERPEKDIRIEAMHALATLGDERRAETIRRYIGNQVSAPDQTVQRAAVKALRALEERFSPTAIEANEKAAQLARSTRTLLADSEAVEEIAHHQAPQKTLDISTLKPGDVLEGRYKYIQRIGKGAFGTVLLMEDSVVEEQLIFKFLNPNVASDEEMMKRFVHELRYSRKITHKNVIRIYDFLYMGGLYAISMEYFPSHTLGNEIVDEKPLEFRRALRFASDIATGMVVAHQVGIIHRDLKPANILINSNDLLKIVDFGVAAAHSSGDTQLTKTGYVIGSPKYMAPEQILGKNVDERADIYSLGVILYEMLTGVPPYTRGDHMSVMYQHVQGKARAPHEINPEIPPDLSALVTKAMDVDKAQRFQSMDEFRESIEQYVK